MKTVKIKTIGSLTATESRQTTEMLEGKWSSLDDYHTGYEVLKDHLDDHELSESDRWFDLEEDENGRMFATSGTVDLDYYIEIKSIKYQN